MRAEEARVTIEQTGPAYVLVLEDDLATRQLIREILEVDVGVSVQEAGEAETALQLLQGSTLPSLIILDLMLPGLDGDVFMRAVRHRFGPDLPIMVLSALRRDQVERSAARGEAQKFMVKPFALDEFIEEVRGLLWPGLSRRPLD